MRLMAWWCCLLVVAACTVGDDDVEPDDEGDPEPLTLEAESGAASGDFATVAQINPYYGGRFSDLNIKGPVTYKTARRMASFIANNWRRLSVIGMEEIADPANAKMIAQILSETTGHPWTAQHFGRATSADAMPATEEAILWRSDVWTPVEVLGTRQIAAVDTSRGPATLSVRVGGMLLRRNGTNHELAIVAGKLTWPGKRHRGRLLDNSDRAEQAQTIMTWIDNKLAGRPDATRVIAVDVNAGYDTAPWKQFRRQYGDGGDSRATHWTFGARRIDGLFWDYDAGAKRANSFGFVGGPYRSANFGSDHRAIAARIRLR